VINGAIQSRRKFPFSLRSIALIASIALFSSNIGEGSSAPSVEMMRPIQIIEEFINVTMTIENDQCLSWAGSARSMKTINNFFPQACFCRKNLFAAWLARVLSASFISLQDLP
jgi:hypothetical protein